jgi:solute carrier family 25 thiamine pyrophosphate transporter 19
MGLVFGSYESLKLSWQRSSINGWIPVWLMGWESFICGGIAGAISKAGVYPFDTIRKRVQVQGPSRSMYMLDLPKYTHVSAWKVAAAIFQQEGIQAFYRGLIPALLKAGPSCAVTFWTFEFTKSVLLEWNATSG